MRPQLMADTLKAVYNTTKRSVCLEGPPGGLLC
jgi:hypothetical protein